jgi:hypothetical protein
MNLPTVPPNREIREGDLRPRESTAVDLSGLEQSVDDICALVDRLREERADLLEAVRAGGRYAEALMSFQNQGLNGQMGTDELERLFMDWYEKGGAAIAKAEGR